MSKVVCTEPLPQIFVDMCRELLPTGAEFVMVSSMDEQEFAGVLADADVLLVIHRRIDARVLALAPRLRLIQRNGLGYENIDVAAAVAAGIPAAYTPGANAGAGAEHTVMFMLALVKRLFPAEQATRAGRWPMMEMAQEGIGDLDGATVGLLGFGHTGRAVAAHLLPFGARLVYYARHRVDAQIEAALHATYLPLPELLASSQIVSLHMPLNDSTRHFMNDATFAQMPRGSYLVNVARGGLVDEGALRRAIESGRLAGAGLDAIQQERPGANPFIDLPQVIVTPHTAGPSKRGFYSLLASSFANIRRVLAGEPPQNLIPETIRPT